MRLLTRHALLTYASKHWPGWQFRLLAGFLLIASPLSFAETAAPRLAAEPELAWAAPLGGRQGSAFEVVVRGRSLAGTTAAWFPCSDVRAVVRKVEDVPPEPPPAGPVRKGGAKEVPRLPEYRVVLQVEVDRDAALGFHNFRLITPRGASNQLALQVVADPVVAEQPKHASAAAAQAVTIPTAVNAALGEKGELDFYAFDVKAGQELLFEVFADFRYKKDDPYRAQAELTLYERTGSWFDPERLTPLVLDRPVLSWEPIPRYRWRDFAAEFVLFPRLSHRFPKAGRYYLSVGAFLGRGAAGSGYVLRIAPLQAISGSDPFVLGPAAHPDRTDWFERDSATMRQFGSFRRRLGPDRLAQLQARTVARSAPPAGAAEVLTGTTGAPYATRSAPGPASAAAPPPDNPISVIGEREPNDTRDAAATVTVPALIEGTIGRPGDVDTFKLTLAAGTRLAFGIETPLAHPPRFDPWLRVFDQSGQERIANIYKEYGGDGIEVNKTLERKTVYTFEAAGDYYLELRSLTSRDGGAEYAYRLLVRPQVPHGGHVELSLGVIYQGSQVTDVTDRMNLPAGEGRALALVCEKEEGFEGDVVFTAEGLPAGVEVLPSSPAAWGEVLLRGMQYRPVGVELVPPDHHRPRREVVTLLVAATADAPLTQLP